MTQEIHKSLWIFLITLLQLSLGACGQETDAGGTQVLVTVDSDLRKDVAKVEVQVLDMRAEVAGSGHLFEIRGDESWPISFAVSPTRGKEGGSFLVTARGLDATGELLSETKGLLTFIKGKTTTAALWLLGVCRGVTCAGLQTCRGRGSQAGTCDAVPVLDTDVVEGGSQTSSGGTPPLLTPPAQVTSTGIPTTSTGMNPVTTEPGPSTLADAGTGVAAAGTGTDSGTALASSADAGSGAIHDAGAGTSGVGANVSTSGVDSSVGTSGADGGSQVTGTCSSVGSGCMLCEPGRKTCQGDAVLTCNAAGQGYLSSSCPGVTRCSGAGQCVGCLSGADCSAMTGGCKVGVCGSGSSCTTQNAVNGTQCATDAGKAGTCSTGVCRCSPQCGNKACGDDGCGGQCPSRCSSSQMCSNSQCVDCSLDVHCKGSADGCQVGACRSGVCIKNNAAGTPACTTSAGSGTCSAGSCRVGPEVAIGNVVSDYGTLYTVGSGNVLREIGPAGWDTCPSGFTRLGTKFDSNGFWLCARDDLTARTFYVGDVVTDYGVHYRVTRGGVTSLGDAGWDTCFDGSTFLGRLFNSNGFWVCMK